MGDVRASILRELADLSANGATQTEFDSATETVRQQLDLIYNEQINDEVLSVLTDPAGNPDFMAFVDQYDLVDQIDMAALAARLAAWLPADQYIAVTVTPR